MNETPRSFGHSKALATAIASALVPVGAHAAVARVDFAVGNVVGVDAQGNARPLYRGSQVNQGDTIRTNRGRAQLRFSDGAFTSLQPETEFRIDDYKFKGEDSGESKGFFSLLKGGLRTITGLIGRLRKDSYKLTTPSATIGIRGTEYLAVIKHSLNVTVGEGSIEVCNNGGCTKFVTGESGYVADDNTKPIHTDEKPQAPPTDPTEGFTFSRDEQVTSDGSADIIGNRFADGPFYALAVAAGDSYEGGVVLGAPGTGASASPLPNATFDPTGSVLLSYQGNTSDVNGYNPYGSGTVSASTTTVTDAGSDGVIGWGRWTSGSMQLAINCDGTCYYNYDISNGVHHYAVGLPTTDFPTGSATYSLIGGTHPTYYDGTGSGTLNSASLSANFGTGQVHANINFTIDSTNFDIANMPASMGSGANRFAFAGSGYYANGTHCSSGCYAAIDGFFAGQQASRAGVAYRVEDPYIDSSYPSIVGAAAFKKN